MYLWNIIAGVIISNLLRTMGLYTSNLMSVFEMLGVRRLMCAPLYLLMRLYIILRVIVSEVISKCVLQHVVYTALTDIKR